MTRRQTTALGEPPQTTVAVPTVTPPRLAWRAHTDRADAADKGAWWYASGPDGRFNLPAPYGTCYLAADPPTALRERLGPRLVALGYVRESDVGHVVVSRLRMPRVRPLADTLAAAAVHIPHLTREIATVIDYPLTRRWAQYLHRARCGGIRYAARHTTGPDALSYAIFGRAGTRRTPPVETIPAQSVTDVHVVSDAPSLRDVALAARTNRDRAEREIKPDGSNTR